MIPKPTWLDTLAAYRRFWDRESSDVSQAETLLHPVGGRPVEQPGLVSEDQMAREAES